VFGAPSRLRGGDAAQREEMHATRCPKVGMRALCAARSVQDLRRLERQQQLGHVAGALLQDTQGGADAAGDGEFQKRLKFRGSGDADVDRQADPFGAPAARPRRSRARPRSRTGWRWPSARRCARRRPASSAAPPSPCRSDPSGSMSRLPSGWPATCRRAKPSKRPGLEKLHRGVERAHRLRDAAAEDQRPAVTPASPR
jgi:hypothetical protein